MSTIYLIVCGAEPASGAGAFVDAAHAHGHDVVAFATPAAVRFIDRDTLASRAGYPVNSEHRPPSEPRRPRPLADAVVIAPATANTVCKLAAGIADTYALDVASENLALGVPVVLVPFVNTVLARRAPYQRALGLLQEEGVQLLDVDAHEPQTGAAASKVFPWVAALAAAERAALCRTVLAVLAGLVDKLVHGRLA
jgi:phosphopantothenoylcysteine synthetase/decarboxylase